MISILSGSCFFCNKQLLLFVPPSKRRGSPDAAEATLVEGGEDEFLDKSADGEKSGFSFLLVSSSASAAVDDGEETGIVVVVVVVAGAAAVCD